jgi:hypothetical protein
MNVNELIGKTLNKIERETHRLIFYCEDGSKFLMFHKQDCCESVAIDDINGDLEDLIGVPILKAEEVSNYEPKRLEVIEKSNLKESCDDSYASHTWTFYKFATINGYVDVKWFGHSNGCYSEKVDFIKADEDGVFDE